MKAWTKHLGLWFGSNKSPILGSREIDVMKILWDKGEQSAQTLHRDMANAEISLSTVQSTLERLYRKKLVSREKSGRFYVYQAQVDQRALVCGLLQDITAQISNGNMAPVVSGFMDFMAEGGMPQEVLSPNSDTSAAKSDSIPEHHSFPRDDH